MRTWFLLRIAVSVGSFATLSSILARPVWSQPAADPKETARIHFERGLELIAQKAWDAALAEFVASRSAYATKNNTQNAAICLKNLKRYDEAFVTLESMRTFNLSKEESAAVERELAELSAFVGSIVIALTEADATVTVDGREVTKPGEPLRVNAGTHAVRAYKAGFMPVEKQVIVTAREKSMVALTLAALERSGRLTIVEESGKAANVFIDNVSVGPTPWQGNFSLGDHSVVLRGEGNLGTQPALANVKANQVTTLTLAIEPLESNLRIEPTPQSASVAIDGVPTGRGLWDGKLRAGRHVVEVTEEDFLNGTQIVTLAPGRAERIAVGLERDPSKIRIPNRVFASVAAWAPFGLVPGGDVRSNCDSGCSSFFPWGAGGVVHVGYQLGMGLGFSVDAGYSVGRLGSSGHTADLELRGSGSREQVSVRDRILYKTLSVGASAHYRKPQGLPLTFRLGLGFWLGSFDDERTAVSVASGAEALPRSESQAATYFYVQPEVLYGYRLTEKLELFAGVSASVLVTASTPKWQNEQSTFLNGSYARYPQDSMLGTFALFVGPTVGTKFDF